MMDVQKDRFPWGYSKRRYWKLAHLHSPDDYEAGEIPGVDKVKAFTRKSQEDISPGKGEKKFPPAKR